jgi:hypothetical protein
MSDDIEPDPVPDVVVGEPLYFEDPPARKEDTGLLESMKRKYQSNGPFFVETIELVEGQSRRHCQTPFMLTLLHADGRVLMGATMSQEGEKPAKLNRSWFRKKREDDQ